MASVIYNVLSSEDIEYLIQLPEVLAAATTSGTFSILLTDSIRSALTGLGIDLSHATTIPMRWMHSDTVPHHDKGAHAFEKTYIVYLNDSTGEFIIGENSYPITANTAFVFNEGTSHSTVGTTSRLLLGPMSELADPVGIPIQSMNYFPTQADAANITNMVYQSSAFYIRNLSQDPGNGSFLDYTYSSWAVDPTNTISLDYNPNHAYILGEDLTVDAYNSGDGFAQYYLYPVFLVYYQNPHDIVYDQNQWDYSTTSYTINQVHGFPYWRLHYASTGTSPQNQVYSSYDTLAAGGTYYLYPSPLITYYATEANALSQTNPLRTSFEYTVETAGGFSRWRVASTSTGSSGQSVIYMPGDDLNSDGVYFLYPVATCFLEGTTILSRVDEVESYRPIETLKPGMLVKTSRDGFKPIVMIGKSELHNPGHSERTENRLYKCSPSMYPELAEDLYITGCHSILVDSITDTERENTVAHLGKIFVTDHKYRLMACVDERAAPWANEGMYTVWHLALDHTDERMNYGIYANGLLVESSSINFMKNKTNMTMV